MGLDVARFKPLSHGRLNLTVSPRFVQMMLAGHSALGVAFAALIYIVCLTGMISVFGHELERWEQPNAPLMLSPPTPAAIQEAIWSGYGQALIDNAAGQVALIAPSELNPRFIVSYADPRTGQDGEWIADNRGHLVERVYAPWTEFVTELHKTLRLPRTLGFVAVGLIGVALLSLLISGLLAHARIFKDAFTLRWGASERLQNADLHNRLAAWGLPFHVLIALTGALLGLSTLIIGVLANVAYNGKAEQAYVALFGPQSRVSHERTGLPDIGMMLKSVSAAHPEGEFAGVQLEQPGSVGGIIRLRIRFPGRLSFAEVFPFDTSGTPIGTQDETGGAGQAILSALQPVHYGWFGGIGTKVLYGLLGLALTVVVQSGVNVWLARRRDKGRKLPNAERIWAGLVWGFPLALAVTAIASLRMPEDAVPPTFVTALAMVGCLVLASETKEEVAARLRLLTGAALVALILLHAHMWGSRSIDPMGPFVSGALLVVTSIVVAIPLYALVVPFVLRTLRLWR